MKMIHLLLSTVLVLMGYTFPVTAFGNDDAKAADLPTCSQPIGSLSLKPVACEALSCEKKAAAPHRGFGLGGLAVKALDKKKLSVTPAALERSKDDLALMLREAFVRTGCFTESTAAVDESHQADFLVEARIVRLDVKSNTSRFGGSSSQTVRLGMDVQISRAGQSESENVSIEANSDKPSLKLRHHAQILHKSGDATALDQAMLEVTVQAVTEVTSRFSKSAGKAGMPTASAADVMK